MSTQVVPQFGIVIPVSHREAIDKNELLVGRNVHVVLNQMFLHATQMRPVLEIDVRMRLLMAPRMKSLLQELT